MAARLLRLLLCLLLPGALLSDAAKILTVSLVGGSHYLLMDHVSRILQDHGHNVTMVKQEGLSLLSDYKEEKKTYQLLKWFLHEDFKKKYTEYFNFFIEESLHGRATFEIFLKFIEHLATQCSHLLRSRDMIDHLTKENFDLIVIEVFDYCPLLITEKLGKPFVSILSSTFGVLEFGLPTPVAYVPVFRSLLPDRMDFWGRVKNLLLFLDFQRKQWQLRSTFDNTIREHFPEGSRPVLSHLLGKAELWFVNSDFAFDFARPLHPNTIYVGGLMAKPVKPIPQSSPAVPLAVHGIFNS
ncbi:PREDICTED: UDP-glucuronosyltransferase 3A2, partial [Elephantulus edwardii]|uniref:UDP-glucuronosyltransferase 3A2 n=1 Tax=Elephantulus edwardii TaxID=28737 RepID=UPI0003F0D8EB